MHQPSIYEEVDEQPTGKRLRSEEEEEEKQPESAASQKQATDALLLSKFAEPKKREMKK